MPPEPPSCCMITAIELWKHNSSAHELKFYLGAVVAPMCKVICGVVGVKTQEFEPRLCLHMQLLMCVLISNGNLNCKYVYICGLSWREVENHLIN